MLSRARVEVVAGRTRIPGTAVRIEIQALRAVAVLLVVLYHLWPRRLTGGFVGVDVFFVISGFLITAHLLRELARTGTISLTRFWARRARRLLPASLLVLVVVLTVTLTAVPDSFWRQWLGEIGASAGYGQNWLLAVNAVDYLAAENAASPVQHFWSLSLEEQFYLVWPVLLLLTALAVRRSRPHLQRAVLLGMMSTALVASLATSVIWTAHLQASAYFVTPTRVWEFAVGGLLAFLPSSLLESRQTVAQIVALAGYAVIGVAALRFNGTMAFPGYVALLPVLGTAAVILAGPGGPGLLSRLLGLPPVQFLGDVSYSMYLWHWPAIVIIPIVAGAPLSTAQKVFIFGASLLVAWISKTQIEDRFRTASAPPRRRSRGVTSLAISSALLVAVVSVSMVGVLDARVAQAAHETSLAGSDTCFGAAAMDPANRCGDPFTGTGSMTPAFAKTDTSYVADPAGGWQCETPRGDSTLRSCTLGNTSHPVRTIAMLGDSHMEHYRAALDALATARNWEIVTYFKSACSGTGASDVVLLVRPDDQQPCAAWGRAAQQAIASNPAVDTVVMANVSQAYMQDDGAHPIQPSRYATAFARLAAAGKKVLVIRDVPRTAGSADVPNCLATTAPGPEACASQQAVSVVPDAAAEAASAPSGMPVRVLDLTDKYCRDGVCHARIGGAIVYSDSSHLTNSFARSLAPYIGDALVDR